MNKTLLLIGASVILTTTHVASAQIAKFEWLDQSFSANDMSPDGKWVVGGALSGGGYIWSRETGYQFIGGIHAVAVSDDGAVVLGSIDHPTTGNSEAAIWTADDESWTLLGTFPGGTGCPGETSAYELSADGTVAVGLGWHESGCSGQGFIWTEGIGAQPLDFLANGNNRASVVSADGSLVAGFAQGSFSRTPAVWLADGTGQVLDPPDGDIVGEVRGMSDDGTVLLGNWDEKAFKWVEGEEIEVFSGPIPAWVGAATDIADDDTIVGFDFIGLSRRAWIRPNGGPAVDLVAYLNSIGTANAPGFLEVCQAISINGNIIIGHNSFANGWRINLCVPDLSGNGAVDFADILAICEEDLDGSGDVGFGDILVVIGAWGDCP